MNYLLDTNIILEYLLDQEKSNEVETFFKTIGNQDLFLSEFSLYSLELFATKGRRMKRSSFFSLMQSSHP